MKIAVIIPDRNDRPEFLQACKSMLASQTIQPDKIIIAHYPATSKECDITERYRISYHMFDGMDYDVIYFMENDDYYAPNYIEQMLLMWQSVGKPDLFGIGYTYYYHLGLKKYVKFEHKRRASMMNTLIKPDLNFKWCADNYAYTDAHLWQTIENRITWIPENTISLGIKHGIGLSGGHFHRTKLDRYDLGVDDSEFTFLREHTTPEMFDFYTRMHEKSFKG